MTGRVDEMAAVAAPIVVALSGALVRALAGKLFLPRQSEIRSLLKQLAKAHVAPTPVSPLRATLQPLLLVALRTAAVPRTAAVADGVMAVACACDSRQPPALTKSALPSWLLMALR